jgi:cytochrome c-type biogenesis protein CcmH
MSGFIAIAGLLTLVVLIALLFPLLRRREGSPEAWRSGSIVAVLIALGAAGLYPLWSNFKWDASAAAADSPEAMVGRLARRLEKEPDDLAGWLRLGRSYGVLEQWPLAIRAYERAYALTKGKNADAALGLAESLLGAERSDLDGRAGKLIEQALALEPDSTGALLYGALAAQERNDLPLAKQRFERLLAGKPPEDARAAIETRIRELDAQIRMGPQPAKTPALAAAEAQPGKSGASAGNAKPVAVPLRVTIAPAVAGKAKPGAPLFISARVPGQKGPPLAAQRLEAKFPLEATLSSTDAMIPGASGFQAGQEIEVEARVGNGGSAISASGDPYGVVRLKAGQSARIEIRIDKLKP